MNKTKIALVIMLVLSSSPLFSQIYPNLGSSRHDKQFFRYEVVDMTRNGAVTTAAHYKDSLYFLMYDHWSRYLGTIKDTTLSKSIWQRSGFGIEREVVFDNHLNGKSQRERVKNVYEYYVGEWKNDKRHGNGYLVSIHNNIYSGKWKNGNFIAGSKREVSEAERQFVEKCIDNLNSIKVKRK